jgi:hypothetical protein
LTPATALDAVIIEHRHQAAPSSASHAGLPQHVRADTSNLQACREAAGTLARSCVMLSPSREATLQSVLLLVSCTLILLGIASAFF